MWSYGFWLRMEGHPWSFSKGKRSTAGSPRGCELASGRREGDWRRLVQTAGRRTPRTPGSELSRTGCPWSRGDSGTAGGGGTCRRSGSVASHCRTPGLQKTQGKNGREDRKWWLIDHAGIRHWGTSTDKFTGHKPPRLVLSASICLLKAQQTRQGEWDQRLLQRSKHDWDVHRMDTASEQNERRREKTRQFYGFVGIFRGTEGSLEVLAKQKEQTNHGSDEVTLMIRESKASSSLWDEASLQDNI